MRTKDYTESDLLAELTKRLSKIDQRERIVVSLPFGKKVTKVEFYCSETTPNKSSSGIAFSGKQFDGILKVSIFNDYGSKPANTNSYTYVNELMGRIEAIVKGIYKIANQ